MVQQPTRRCCCGCTCSCCISTAVLLTAVVAWQLLQLLAGVLGEIEYTYHEHFASKEVYALAILDEHGAEQLALAVQLQEWLVQDPNGRGLVQEAAARYRETFPAIGSIQVDHGKRPQYRDDEFDGVFFHMPVFWEDIYRARWLSGALVASDSIEEIQDFVEVLRLKHREKLGKVPIRLIRLGSGAAVHGRITSVGDWADALTMMRLNFEIEQARHRFGAGVDGDLFRILFDLIKMHHDGGTQIRYIGCMILFPTRSEWSALRQALLE